MSKDSSERAKGSLEEWFSKQHVLVTGATGFMGKIVVEKLLRCCPELEAIYIVVRTKRGRDFKQRLEDFVNLPIFDQLRDSKGSSVLNKIKCIPGDICSKDLGMKPQDVVLLQDNITTVFHMAANVRFDQPLKPALAINTGGTKNLLDLALTFTQLECFVHVSTSYCHCDQVLVEERTYPAPHDPKKMLDLSTWMQEDLLNLLTPKLLGQAPNTYAYTKCLTEHLVSEYATKIPIAIARPSIVTAAWKEPIPGWVDNLNGPTGLLVAAGKGIVRSMHCDANLEADIMPVDVATNGVILTSWKLGTSPKSEKPLVVNITSSKDNPVTWGEIIELTKKHFYENPFSVCLWYPGGSIKSSYIIHVIAAFCFHIIPAYFIDFLLTITMGKPFLVRTQKRIQNGLEVLQYYTTRPWKFHNNKIKEIALELQQQQRDVFYTDLKQVNWDQYALTCVLGARKYCMHEEPQTIPYARKVLRRLYYLDVAKNALLIGVFFWFIFLYATTIFDGIEMIVSKVIASRPGFSAL